MSEMVIYCTICMHCVCW